MNFGGALRFNKCSCFILSFFILMIFYWRSGLSHKDSSKQELVNLKYLLKAGILAAELGGEKVIELQKDKLHIQNKGKTLEGANDPVTNADYASHCAMISSLSVEFPTIKIISEETTSEKSCNNLETINSFRNPVEISIIENFIDEYVNQEDVTIWIDPLDATQEYTEHLNQYVTTMVCVVVRGVPVIGVIHKIEPPETFWAWNSKKASSNIPFIKHESEKHLKPHVVVSRSHTGNVEDFVKRTFHNSSVERAGGAGYKVLTVLNGTNDLYIHTTLIKKWDICAGNAIVNQLRGSMTTLSGSKIDYSSNKPVQVTDGLLVSLFDHDYYLDKVSKLKKVKLI